MPASTRDKRRKQKERIRATFARNLRAAMAKGAPAGVAFDAYAEPDKLQRGRIKQFADAAGVTPAAVSNYLAGARLPDATVLPDVQSVISEWLGRPVTIDELLTRNLKK